jgi:hypothetical protein
MAAPLTLAQITGAYDEWHVPYKVYSGAGTRGRPGGITPHGITEHHTGGGSASSSYLYFLFVTGRPAEGIPGPLCSEATDSGGTVWIGAVGRANHAGMGSSVTRDHVVAEDYNGYTAELKPGPDNINGNPLYYGNEWIYSGTRPPTAAQFRGAALAAAARCDAHGWSALSVVAHREHSHRKRDPFGVLMYEFRRTVGTLLKAGPKATVNYVATGKLVVPSTPPPVTDTTGDDMPWTEAQLRAMMQAEEEEYAIRFWIDPTGTGTALRNQVTFILNQIPIIQGKLDHLLADHANVPAALAATDVQPAVTELHAAMETAVNQLAAAPMKANLATLLNADGTMEPVYSITDAEGPEIQDGGPHDG